MGYEILRAYETPQAKEDPTIDELGLKFAKLSVKAEEEGHFSFRGSTGPANGAKGSTGSTKRAKGPTGSAKRTKNSHSSSPGQSSSADPNPFVKRNLTAKELIDGIDKLQDLCREVQDDLDPYIEAERMEKDEIVRNRDFTFGFMNKDKEWVAKPEDFAIEDLEKEFARLSIKAERQGSFKVEEYGSSKRRATKQELIDGIDKLQDLCRETADMCDPYIEAKERMEKSKLVQFLNFVLHYL
ncbi:hypothetical protein PG988_011818 [Apiospora saccharicola]